MKITQNDPSSKGVQVNPLATERVSADGKAKEAGAALLKESSKVSLSERGKNYAKIKKVVESTPDIRAEKVAKLKKLIAEGNYKIDSEKIADAMISETIKDEILSGEIL